MVGPRLAALTVALVAIPHSSAAQGAIAGAGATEPQEVRPQFLTLPDFLTPRESMLSGLAWYGDELILLPQQRPIEGQRSIHRGKLYSISRRALESAIDGRSDTPLAVDAWELVAPGVDTIDGFEGFEAIAFAGDTVFMTVESDIPRRPGAWLLRGQVDARNRSVRMEPADVFIPGQSGLNNLTEEALVVHGAEVISMHEANGSGVNPNAVAHAFPTTWQPGRPWRGRTIAMTAIEYRVTDATAADDAGRFWVTNCFYPGDRPLKASDRVFGGPPSQGRAARVAWVERLVELRVTPDGVVSTGRPPIYLEPGEESRNWEGIVRLGSRGFVLVVDKYPSTRLAFVPSPVR